MADHAERRGSEDRASVIYYLVTEKGSFPLPTKDHVFGDQPLSALIFSDKNRAEKWAKRAYGDYGKVYEVCVSDGEKVKINPQ